MKRADIRRREANHTARKQPQDGEVTAIRKEVTGVISESPEAAKKKRTKGRTEEESRSYRNYKQKPRGREKEADKGRKQEEKRRKS
jgi:hypothetical protein